MLFLNDLAFFNFHVLAAFAVGLPARLLDGNDAHLHRDEAAIDFDGTKSEVHVCLAAKDGKAEGLLDSTDDAVHTRTGGEQQLAAAEDQVGDNGEAPAAALCFGAADSAPEGGGNLRGP